MGMAQGVRGTARALGAALGIWFMLAAAAPAADSTITVIVKPGDSDAAIAEAMRAAAATGLPVRVELSDADASKAPTASPAAADADADAPASQTTSATSPAAAPASGKAPAAAPAPEAAAPETASAALGTGLDAGAALESLSENLGTSVGAAFAGVDRLDDVAGVVAAEIAASGHSPGGILLAFLTTLLAAGLPALALKHGLLRLFRPKLEARDALQKLRRAGGRALIAIAALMLFTALAYLVLQRLLPRDTVMIALARAPLVTVAIGLGYGILASFLLSPRHPALRLLPIDRARWHWFMLVSYGTISAFLTECVRFAGRFGLDRTAITGVILIGGTVLTLHKLIWFIGGRREIRAAFAGPNPGPLRRAIAFGLPEFYALSAVVLWLAGVLMLNGDHRGALGQAFSATQAILVILPILALGMHALIGVIGKRRAEARAALDTAVTTNVALEAATIRSLQTALAGVVWLVGLNLVVGLWRPILSGHDRLGMLAFLETAQRFSFAVVACWVGCSFLWGIFEVYSPTPRKAMPGSEDELPPVQASRLSTVMPVIRNLAFGATLAITVLVVLSSLGIDVAPLIAGFGVLGLAISFGSQTLVKDIVSGIFFIADDAFRVGEYVDTGKLKGTVEHISLRSLRLRHQNGFVHTIPFGQLQSVTNFSRDWSTIKFQLRFDKEADLELIRKTVKKVGLAMLEDPELGPEFLVPLKMQGIQDVTETSLIIRLKFTCRPGQPTLIQRAAMKRLLPALREAGLQLASNAVVVRGGEAAADLSGAAAASRYGMQEKLLAEAEAVAEKR
ncbi:mechanosensitive ion channel family protein [Rhizobium rhizosphaerae]|nr:mechanosensitive ion channel family protein [Xaviernesmea rhizosphaerae]